MYYSSMFGSPQKIPTIFSLLLWCGATIPNRYVINVALKLAIKLCVSTVGAKQTGNFNFSFLYYANHSTVVCGQHCKTSEDKSINES